jgi:endo-1,4-beta-xylanase
MNRRRFMKMGSQACATSAVVLTLPSLSRAEASPQPTLKSVAAKAGKIVGMYTSNYSLNKYPDDSNFIAQHFSMIADGNDLKMERLRPSPDRFDFTTGDAALSWAKQRSLLVRGHCLVWGEALPPWFNAYVTRANAKDVLTKHVETVMSHYAGQMYSWDVVNEAFREHDRRPDGLRVAPWLNLLGPDYIGHAFRVAAASDPAALLVLNETHIEHDRPEDNARRAHMLALLRTLRGQNVPVQALGIQSHLTAGVPLGRDLPQFLNAVRQLGLRILITEMDVDDTMIPDHERDEVVAETYRSYLEIVGKAANPICFEQLTDRGNWFDGANLPRRSDGSEHRPDLLDKLGRPKKAFTVVCEALAKLSR